MDYGICSIIVAFIMGVCSIISAFCWGYVPKKRKEEIISLQKELLDVYIGVSTLKTIEENLESQLGISKQAARKGLIVTDRLQRNRIEKRIIQLQSIIQ
jgi:hypothetical protein